MSSSFSESPADPQALESDRPADPSIAGLAQQVDDAVERVRREFRQRAAEEWSLAVPLLRTALDLCSTLKARRLALDGRSEAELFEYFHRYRVSKPRSDGAAARRASARPGVRPQPGVRAEA